MDNIINSIVYAIETFFNIPINRDSKDSIDIPRFYLCEEGTIYHN